MIYIRTLTHIIHIYICKYLYLYGVYIYMSVCVLARITNKEEMCVYKLHANHALALSLSLYLSPSFLLLSHLRVCPHITRSYIPTRVYTYVYIYIDKVSRHTLACNYEYLSIYADPPPPPPQDPHLSACSLDRRNFCMRHSFIHVGTLLLYENLDSANSS